MSISCNQRRDPLKVEKDVLRMKINGKLWSAERRQYLGGYLYSCDIDSIGEGDFGINAYNVETFDTTFTSFSMVLKNIKTTGQYALSIDNTTLECPSCNVLTSFISAKDTFLLKDSTQSHINVIQFTKGLVGSMRAQFNMTLYGKHTDSVLVITEGYFDGQITQK
jgi:hypothetical protein